MAVKKNGYVNEKNGVYLPEAYGILEAIKVRNNNYVTATFAVKASREHISNVDTVSVNFVWDRKTNLAEMAYNEAKGKKTVVSDYEIIDDESKPIETIVYGPFYGWQDDRI